MNAPASRGRRKPSPIPFPVQMPFVESLGIELHRYGDGQARCRPLAFVSR